MADTSSEKSKSSNTGCLDIFALFTGSIGLTVDGIALISLIFAVVNVTGNDAEINSQALPTFAILILFALILIYSWFALSWYLSRRYFNNTKSINDDDIASIVFATGGLTIPIWWMWVFFLNLSADQSIETINIGNTIFMIVVLGSIGLAALGAIISIVFISITNVLLPVIYLDIAMYYKQKRTSAKESNTEI